MKKVKTMLTVLLWTVVALSVVLAVLFETGILTLGFCAGVSKQTEFLLTTAMELLTLAVIPLSLKLFKFSRVQAELLSRKADALRKWGLLRLSMLLLPMLLNTLLYYIYANVAFGYMAIILVIVLPFVYPSMERCLSEVGEA